jgi:hypothetical protein
MRCIACNVVLSEVELTLKTPSNQFADLCGNCYYSTFNDEYENEVYSEPQDIEDVLKTLNVFEEHRYEQD